MRKPHSPAECLKERIIDGILIFLAGLGTGAGFTWWMLS